MFTHTTPGNAIHNSAGASSRGHKLVFVCELGSYRVSNSSIQEAGASIRTRKRAEHVAFAHLTASWLMKA